MVLSLREIPETNVKVAVWPETTLRPAVASVTPAAQNAPASHPLQAAQLFGWRPPFISSITPTSTRMTKRVVEAMHAQSVFGIFLSTFNLFILMSRLLSKLWSSGICAIPPCLGAAAGSHLQPLAAPSSPAVAALHRGSELVPPRPLCLDFLNGKCRRQRAYCRYYHPQSGGC